MHSELDSKNGFSTVFKGSVKLILKQRTLVKFHTNICINTYIIFFFLNTKTRAKATEYEDFFRPFN